MSTSAHLSLDRIRRALEIAEKIASLEAELEGLMEDTARIKEVAHSKPAPEPAKRRRKKSR